MVPTQGTEVEVDNIYAILPPPGTIIGEATEEEWRRLQSLKLDIWLSCDYKNECTI